MSAHAPDRQDPVQIIARFVRGNWDLPEQVGAGLIEELASEGWIITRAQVFKDMLMALEAARVVVEAEGARATLVIVDATIAKATESGQ